LHHATFHNLSSSIIGAARCDGRLAAGNCVIVDSSEASRPMERTGQLAAPGAVPVTQRVLMAAQALFLSAALGNVLPSLTIVVEGRCCVNRKAIIDRDDATSSQRFHQSDGSVDAKW
jgi:hypothetical protein